MRKNLILLLFFIGVNIGHAQIPDSLIKVISGERSPEMRLQLWAQLAFTYAKSSNDSGYAFAISNLLTTAFATHNDTLLGEVYVFLGSNAEDKGDFDHALEYLFKALQIAENINYRFDISQAAEQIAVVYKQLKNSKEALRFLRKAEKFVLVDEIKNSMLPRAIYANTAEIYLSDRDLDSALVYTQKANAVTKKESDEFGYSRVLLDFGQVYSLKGDNDLAETYFKKGIAFCDSAGENLNLVSTLYEYSNHFLRNNNPEQAKIYALRSLAEHNEFRKKAGTLSIEITHILSKVYRDLKQFDSAYFYASLNSIHRDSVFNERRLNSIQDLTFAQKVHEVEAQKLKEDEKIQAKNLLQNISIGIALITFLVVFLLMSHTTIFNSKLINFFSIIGLLLVFEFINLLLHPFLEEKTHHSPVLMFLLLVAIAALIVPLHHKLEKWVVRKMTEKNNRIRLAAAKKIIEVHEFKEKMSSDK